MTTKDIAKEVQRGVWVRKDFSRGVLLNSRVTIGLDLDEMSSDHFFMPLSSSELDSPESIGRAVLSKLGLSENSEC